MPMIFPNVLACWARTWLVRTRETRRTDQTGRREPLAMASPRQDHTTKKEKRSCSQRSRTSPGSDYSKRLEADLQAELNLTLAESASSLSEIFAGELVVRSSARRGKQEVGMVET